MKKILTFSLLVFLVVVLIGGCNQQQSSQQQSSQQQTRYVCPDGSTVSDASYCQKSQPQTSGTPVECTSNEQCPRGVCDMGTWKCREVTVTPVKEVKTEATGNVGCTSNEQCPGGVCDTGSHTCKAVSVNPWYVCPDGSTLVHSLSDCPK